VAVLPASKAYPRGGAPKRSYVAGAPLFAKMAMRFLGVEYKRGDALPVEKMSQHKHWELWLCGKADHSTHGPFDKVKAAPVAAEVKTEVAVSEGAVVEVVEGEATGRESAVAAPAAVEVVETPKQRQRRSKE
jgi:hypothetical protein